MKRAAVLLAIGLSFGCSHDQGTPAPSPESPSSAQPQMQYPSHEGEPAGMYYETVRDGNTYVTGYVKTANMIRNGDIPSYMVEKKNFGPDGQTVYFEDDGKGLSQRLEKDYLAQHKK